MSTEVISLQQMATPVKRSKSHKRKHADLSQSPAVVPDSQPSPSKKPKRTEGKSDSKQHVLTTSSAFRKPTNSPSSPFALKTLSLYLPLAPIVLQTPISGLCAEHLSPLLLTYYPPLSGVVLSYSNPRLSESPDDVPQTQSHSQSQRPQTFAVSVAEYAASFVWLTADFVVLQPQPRTPIEGWINLQSETHLGLMCWNLFSATIARARMPADWRWVSASADGAAGKRRAARDKLKKGQGPDDVMDVDEADDAVVEDVEGAEDESEAHGHWVDGDGAKITGQLTFNVVELDALGSADAEASYVTIRGTLLDEEDEAKVIAKEREDWEKKFARRRKEEKVQTSFLMSGAQPTETVEVNEVVAKDKGEGDKRGRKEKQEKQGKDVKKREKPKKSKSSTS